MVMFGLLFGVWGLAILICPILVIVLFNRIGGLEDRLYKLEKNPSSKTTPSGAAPDAQTPAAPATAKMPVCAERVTPAPPPAAAKPAVCAAHADETLREKPLQTAAHEAPAGRAAETVRRPAEKNDVIPPAEIPAPKKENIPAPRPVPSAARAPKTNPFTIEQLLSWTGGFILFLGLALGIKYSIDNGLLTPVARMMLSTAAGLGLLITGLCLRKEQFKITSETLSGCGLAVLYVSVFSAHTFYELLSANTAFVLMAAIALLSFTVAVWRNAKYIGFLAVITAFLTPFLLGSQEPHTVFFLSYLAFINAAAVCSALKRNWSGILNASALFTFLSQCAVFFNADFPAKDAAAFCAFCAAYAAAAVWIAAHFSTRLSVNAQKTLGFFTAFNLVFVCSGLYSYSMQPCAAYFLGLGLWLNAALACLAYQENSTHAHAFLTGKALIFVALLIWMQQINPDVHPLLVPGIFLAVAAINGGTDFWLYKKRGITPGLTAVLFPTALMIPSLLTSGFTDVSVWILMSLLLVLAAVYAFIQGVPAAALASVILLLVAVGWGAPGLRRAAEDTLNWTVTFGFAMLPALALFALTRRFGKAGKTLQAELTLFISSLMPYFLAAAWLANTSGSLHLIFGFALALTLLNGFFVYVYKNGKQLLGALAGVTLLELTFHANGLDAFTAAAFIKWTAGLFAFFALYPFVFKKRLGEDVSVWRACALGGLIAAGFIYAVIKTYYQLSVPGMLPLAFALLYLTFVHIVYFWQPVQEGIQRSRLVWLGGTALAFITAIFPIQFSMQTLTLAWAFEGAALIWLNRKINHTGLLVTGGLLLAAVFVRLLPFIPLGESFENGIGFWNRYLYTFGLSGTAMCLAAHWWKSANNQHISSVLKGMAAIVFFILLNIQIAVQFYTDGPLAFNFTGDFASAIMYTAGWTFFGALLMLAGWNNKRSAAWVSGLVLIVIALWKLFQADIWTLSGLHRIIGMWIIAAILIAVSFVFQSLRRKR